MYGISDHRCTVKVTTDVRYWVSSIDVPIANTVLHFRLQETAFRCGATTGHRQIFRDPSLISRYSRHSNHITSRKRRYRRTRLWGEVQPAANPDSFEISFDPPCLRYANLRYTVPRFFLFGQYAFSTGRGSGPGRWRTSPAGTHRGSRPLPLCGRFADRTCAGTRRPTSAVTTVSRHLSNLAAASAPPEDRRHENRPGSRISIWPTPWVP
jgi:hypothetical protein